MRRIKPDFLLATVIAALLMLALKWCVDSSASPFEWRSFR